MIKVHALQHGNTLWVQHAGRIYRITAHAQKSAAAASENNTLHTKELIAPFNCKVVKVHVVPNQAVAIGDAIVSVEAMKMEYTYTSPRAGIIAAVNVREAETITEGTEFIRWGES